MTLRHRIDAALLVSEGLKIADTVVLPTRTIVVQGPVPRSTPLASMAAFAERAMREGLLPEPTDLGQNLHRMLARTGLPQGPLAPMTQLPEADPAILSSVLEQARHSRDPVDYLRLLSHDKDVNSMARTAALPALLLSDMLAGSGQQDGDMRATLINILQNLQMPAGSPAAPPTNPQAPPARYPG